MFLRSGSCVRAGGRVPDRIRLRRRRSREAGRPRGCGPVLASSSEEESDGSLDVHARARDRRGRLPLERPARFARGGDRVRARALDLRGGLRRRVRLPDRARGQPRPPPRHDRDRARPGGQHAPGTADRRWRRPAQPRPELRRVHPVGRFDLSIRHARPAAPAARRRGGDRIAGPIQRILRLRRLLGGHQHRHVVLRPHGRRSDLRHRDARGAGRRVRRAHGLLRSVREGLPLRHHQSGLHGRAEPRGCGRPPLRTALRDRRPHRSASRSDRGRARDRRRGDDGDALGPDRLSVLLRRGADHRRRRPALFRHGRQRRPRHRIDRGLPRRLPRLRGRYRDRRLRLLARRRPLRDQRRRMLDPRRRAAGEPVPGALGDPDSRRRLHPRDRRARRGLRVQRRPGHPRADDPARRIPRRHDHRRRAPRSRLRARFDHGGSARLDPGPHDPERRHRGRPRPHRRRRAQRRHPDDGSMSRRQEQGGGRARA